MTQRFVIQGCPTLITKLSKVTDNLLCTVVNSLFLATLVSTTAAQHRLYRTIQRYKHKLPGKCFLSETTGSFRMKKGSPEAIKYSYIIDI